MPDRDAQPPPDSNSSPHTKVSVTDFRAPTVDTDVGFPYGSRFRSPHGVRDVEGWPGNPRCTAFEEPRAGTSNSVIKNRRKHVALRAHAHFHDDPVL